MLEPACSCLFIFIFLTYATEVHSVCWTLLSYTDGAFGIVFSVDTGGVRREVLSLLRPIRKQRTLDRSSLWVWRQRTRYFTPGVLQMSVLTI